MSLKNKTTTKKKWPLYCFYAAIAMVLLAVILYFVYCRMINSEFSHNKEFFGEAFDELYTISDPDDAVVDPLLTNGKKALNTIGSGEEFGPYSRYCIDPALYPDAHSVDASIEVIAGSIEKNSGYLWVAYHQAVYDADGNLVTASGSEDERILSRWSIEKLDGKWSVSEIKEKP